MFNVKIKNYFQNPILTPDSKKNFEKRGIFNSTAIVKDKKVFLFYQANDKINSVICLATSRDGINFKKYNKNPIIKERGAKCANPRITKIEKEYFLTYEVTKKTNKTHLYKAFSKNLLLWGKKGKIISKKSSGAIVQDYQDKGVYLGYFGKNYIQIGFSKDLASWKIEKKSVLSIRKRFYDKEKIEIGPNPIVVKQGILFIYNAFQKQRKKKLYTWGGVLFDKEDPGKILWRSKKPIFSSEKDKITLGGLVKFQKRWLLYYYSEIDKGINVAFLNFWEEIKDEDLPKLIKFEQNPILEIRNNCLWESKGVFNAAVIYEQGKVYLVYRSITENDISVMGLAVSEDGINISERLTEPIYFPREPFELNPSGKRTYNYLSGWGHSGCEDPRIVKIDDRFYMIYIAFDGGNPPGVALTSIKVNDFLNRKWKWKRPVLISPPGELHKNWVIFPEKINNKYAILHSISPKILIRYVDNLNYFNGTKYINSYYEPSQIGYWEDWVRGAGPPPIKTGKGWLIFYHAMESRDSGKYKLGAMILDFKDPRRILARSKRPILEPNPNLNIGKLGVVYSCGSVIIKDKLFVYYGRNDYNLGVATTNLDEFLEKLMM